MTDLVIGANLLEIPLSHEARAINFRTKQDWKNAVLESRKWLFDEPFSTRPASLGSFIAAEHLEDYALCEQICVDGLAASPNDTNLLNNLAFALANQGKTAEAQKALDRISFVNIQPSNEVSVYATQGCVYFRMGDLVKGRSSYNKAIETSVTHHLETHQISAALHLAMEEAKHDLEMALPPLKLALRIIPANRNPLVQELLRRLQKILVHQSDETNDLNQILNEVEELNNKPQILPNLKFRNPS